MALTWGNWVYSGGNGMRVGLNPYNGSGVDTNSSQFTFSWEIWTENQYNYSDTQTMSYDGCGGPGSFSYNNSGATGTSALRTTRPCAYGYPAGAYGPGSSVQVGITATASGLYNGGAPNHTVYVQAPARPYAPSYAPTNVVATYNSDSQITITSTHPSDAQHPNDIFYVDMNTFPGSVSAWQGWVNVYGGGSSTYVQTGLSSNTVYEFQCCLANSAGQSAHVSTGHVYTTPAAPTGCTATTVGTNQIRVDWVRQSYWTALIRWDVERRLDGGAWVRVASQLDYPVTSWTDGSPGFGSNQYRVRTTEANGGLVSAWTNTNSLSTNNCWVFDGTVAQPAIMRVWDGTAEVEATVSVQP